MSTMLEAELLAHLDTQLASARRLLALVLDQGGAIRSRDVDGVLAKLAGIQTEMGRRGALEQERAGVLQRAGAALGVPATEVTLERLCLLVTPGAADMASAMVAMIESQRAFELTSKAIHTADQMWEIANGVKR